MLIRADMWWEQIEFLFQFNIAEYIFNKSDTHVRDETMINLRLYKFRQ